MEDSPDPDRMLATGLVTAGADVTLECSVESALDVVARSVPFDLVVLALSHGARPGVADLFRDAGRGVYVVAVSAAEPAENPSGADSVVPYRLALDDPSGLIGVRESPRDRREERRPPRHNVRS